MKASQVLTWVSSVFKNKKPKHCTHPELRKYCDTCSPNWQKEASDYDKICQYQDALAQLGMDVASNIYMLGLQNRESYRLIFKETRPRLFYKNHKLCYMLALDLNLQLNINHDLGILSVAHGGQAINLYLKDLKEDIYVSMNIAILSFIREFLQKR